MKYELPLETFLEGKLKYFFPNKFQGFFLLLLIQMIRVFQLYLSASVCLSLF